MRRISGAGAGRAGRGLDRGGFEHGGWLTSYFDATVGEMMAMPDVEPKPDAT